MLACFSGRQDHHVLFVCDLLTGVILKGQTLQKCVFDVCVRMLFCFMFALGAVLWIDSRKGLI